jgi:hypothetical protein
VDGRFSPKLKVLTLLLSVINILCNGRFWLGIFPLRKRGRLEGKRMFSVEMEGNFRKQGSLGLVFAQCFVDQIKTFARA